MIWVKMIGSSIQTEMLIKTCKLEYTLHFIKYVNHTYVNTS